MPQKTVEIFANYLDQVCNFCKQGFHMTFLSLLNSFVNFGVSLVEFLILLSPCEIITQDSNTPVQLLSFVACRLECRIYVLMPSYGPVGYYNNTCKNENRFNA